MSEGARRMGSSLTPAQVDQFTTYLHLLRRWAAKINLTSIIAPQAIIDRHFCDSLALWSVVPPPQADQTCRLLDVGSGGGFPGVPLKVLAPTLLLTLLEPRHKRAAFLQTLIATLGCAHTTVVTKQLADLSPSHQNQYAWVTARGVGRLDQLAQEAFPLLAPGGLCVFYLSKSQPTQMLSRSTNYTIAEHPYRLPFSGIERRLLIISRGDAPLPSSSPSLTS